MKKSAVFLKVFFISLNIFFFYKMVLTIDTDNTFYDLYYDYCDLINKFWNTPFYTKYKITTF